MIECLKIKDHVDLKELEKFGFVCRKYNKIVSWYVKCYGISGGFGYPAIIIYGDNTPGKRQMCFDANLDKPDVRYWALSQLYDLINAGFVEKVAK